MTRQGGGQRSEGKSKLLDVKRQSGGNYRMVQTQPQMSVRADVKALQITPQSPRMSAILAGSVASLPPRETGELKSEMEALKALI